MIKQFLQKFYRPKLPYEAQKAKITSQSVADRLLTAQHKETKPEVLYYLASDDDASVRRAVAAHAKTPHHVNLALSKDKDLDVRLILMKRLVGLLPSLDENRLAETYAFVVNALKILAQDELLKVRKALALALCYEAAAPRDVIAILVRDIEREVSAPLLRYCTLLADDDLIGILKDHPDPWVIEAVSARPSLSTRLLRFLFQKATPDLKLSLLHNRTHRFDDETLKEIVADAPMHATWHEPLCLRPELTAELARLVAGFVSETLLYKLKERDDFDPLTQKDILAVVERRLYFSAQTVTAETVAQKIKRYALENRLNDEAIRDALAWGEKEFARHALVFLTAIPYARLLEILNLQSAKAIVALSWLAKLKARTAVDVQMMLAQIKPKDVIYAKGGTDYALSEAEMKWQLEFLGITPRS
jgi:uncharacterized protein (DUF2336 family)